MTEIFHSPTTITKLKRGYEPNDDGESGVSLFGQSYQSAAHKRQRHSMGMDIEGEGCVYYEDKVSSTSNTGSGNSGIFGAHNRFLKRPREESYNHNTWASAADSSKKSSAMSTHNADSSKGQGPNQEYHSRYEESKQRSEIEITQLKAANATLSDENRILKKAVALQEHKLREANHQGRQLQDILSQVSFRSL